MDFLAISSVVLIFLLGVIHSILGEHLIFQHLRRDGSWIDTNINGLRVRQIRALYGTWHLITLFGWVIAAVLLVGWYFENTSIEIYRYINGIVSLGFVIATPFWFVVTKGKHPAWIVFLLIALFTGTVPSWSYFFN